MSGPSDVRGCVGEFENREKITRTHTLKQTTQVRRANCDNTLTTWAKSQTPIEFTVDCVNSNESRDIFKTHSKDLPRKIISLESSVARVVTTVLYLWHQHPWRHQATICVRVLNSTIRSCRCIPRVETTTTIWTEDGQVFSPEWPVWDQAYIAECPVKELHVCIQIPLTIRPTFDFERECPVALPM